MTDTFNSVMGELGITIEDESLVVENKGGRYEFGVGEYTVLVGDLSYKYTNADNKACEKTDVGAKLGYGQQDFLVLKALGKEQVNKNFEIDVNLPPGAFTNRLFIPFQADKQFQNKNLYEDFYIDNQPTLSIIQPVDKTFKVNFAAIPVYRGCPAIMTIEKKTAKSGKEYLLAGFKLSSHTIDKDTLINRGKVVDKLYEQIQALWDKTKAEAGTKEKPSEVAPDSAGMGDIMNDFS